MNTLPGLLNSLDQMQKAETPLRKLIIAANYKVRAAFDFWWEPEDEAPFPSFVILESNNPFLAKGSHVTGDQLLECRVNLPVYPRLEWWIEQGRPRYNGETA